MAHILHKTALLPGCIALGLFLMVAGCDDDGSSAPLPKTDGDSETEESDGGDVYECPMILDLCHWQPRYCSGNEIVVCFFQYDENGCAVGEDYRVTRDCSEDELVCIQTGSAFDPTIVCAEPESADGDDDTEDGDDDGGSDYSECPVNIDLCDRPAYCSGNLIMVCHIVYDEYGCESGEEYDAGVDCAELGKVCEEEFGHPSCVEPASPDGDQEESDGDREPDSSDMNGDPDETELPEAEEVDYSSCVDDPYTGNISYNTAYRLPSESQTLDDIVVCMTRDDWFVMNLQAGTYFYERTTTQDGSTSSGTFYISDDENILGESLAYAYAVDFTPEGQKTSQLVVEIPETRDYFLAVRRNPVGSSPAALEISLHNEFPVIPGNDCREPFEINPQAEAPQFYFSSWRYEMLTNNFHGSCMPVVTGRDFVIGLDVSRDSHVVFDTASDVDIGIYVRTACDVAASELGCADADMIREHLELDLVTGRYYIIIDAYEPDGADWFTLSVQMTALE